MDCSDRPCRPGAVRESEPAPVTTGVCEEAMRDLVLLKWKNGIRGARPAPAPLSSHGLVVAQGLVRVRVGSNGVCISRMCGQGVVGEERQASGLAANRAARQESRCVEDAGARMPYLSLLFNLSTL